MNSSDEKQAFARGIADFCSRNGIPEFSVPLAKFAEYSDAFEVDPEAFNRGVDRFIKTAYADDDRRGFLRKLLPWILVPAGLYGALQLGDAWGRHASDTKNPRGPIKGIFHKILEDISGKDLSYVGRKAGRTLAESPRYQPISREAHEWLDRTGIPVDPDFFG